MDNDSVPLPLMDGRTIRVHRSTALRVVGVDPEGDIVVAGWRGLELLTSCCGVEGYRWTGGGAVCWVCLREMPGKYATAAEVYVALARC